MTLCVFAAVTVMTVTMLPGTARSREDTIHLTFEKKGVIELDAEEYVVKPGEWIYKIIRDRYPGSPQEHLEVLDRVKELNPALGDVDRVYPGQKIMLPPPGAGREEVSDSGEPEAPAEDGSAKESVAPADDSPAKEPVAPAEGVVEYPVKRGQTVSGIIHDELGAKHGEIYNILETVKNLNPDIPDMDVVREGQVIRLPQFMTLTGDDGTKADEPAPSRADTVEKDMPPEEPVPSEIPAETDETGGVTRYVVKEGDSVSRIIHRRFGVPYNRMVKYLNMIRELNPDLGDLDRIEPGQELLLPEIVPADDGEKTKTDETTDEPETSLMPVTAKIDVIENMVSLMGGTVSRDGTVYIPISTSGQIAVDCKTVPVAEYDDGTMVLIDVNRRIPPHLSQVIENLWGNYTVIDGASMRTVAEELVRATKGYELTKNDYYDYTTISGIPDIKIFFDWTVTRLSPSRTGVKSFGVNFISHTDLLLPENIARALEKRDMPVVEVVAGEGLQSRQDGYEPQTVTALSSGTIRVFAASVLDALGYGYRRDADVDVFDIKRDGLNLSLKADFIVAGEEGDLIITTEAIPRHFSRALKDRGAVILVLETGVTKKETLAAILRALKLNDRERPYQFSFAEWNEEKRGYLVFTAIRAERPAGNIFFVTGDVDSDINAILKNQWGVDIRTY